MKKVYFAHPMCVYGDRLERRQLTQIRKQFRPCKVVNPALYNKHPQKRRDTVGFCLKLVEGCDAVVFARLFDKVTAGVGKEVNHALKIGKEVFELKDSAIVRRIRSVKYISRHDTIALYWKYCDRSLFSA